MLDQLLATASGRIDEAGVRDLLGLAESESVDRLVGALVDGDAVAGIAVLDELDDRGRDIGIVLDQVIDAIRAELSAGLASGADPARLLGLTRVARRLSEIDPERRGVGGLRLQVELAVFAAVAGRGPDRVPAVATQPVEPDVRSTPPEPAPAEDPAPKRSSAATPKPAAVEPEAAAPPVAPDVQAPVPHSAIGSAADANPELDRLTAGWADVVASVRPATRAIISECRPMAIDGNVITLGFPEAKAFLKEVADRKRPDLEAAVGAFLGRTVAVRCVATNLDLVPAAADDEQANVLYAEARRIFADQLEDIGEVS
jgi:DNA polymerase III gamma/tau subunit